MGNLISGNKRDGGVGSSSAAQQLVQDLITQHPVAVFSKTYCPFCSAAKRALKEESQKVTPPTPIHVIELDMRDDGDAIQAALVSLTGQRTVPNVFIGGESIGGGDDTCAAQTSGVLKQMLASAGTKLAAGVGASNDNGSGSDNGNSDGNGNNNNNMETATFAAGCFWGVELYFQRIPGVLTTAVGYTQGKVNNPTYKQVCSGRTGHTEAVQLTFDPQQLSYAELLQAYWTRKGFNAAQVNGQGNDHGTQYRSGIYAHGDNQLRLATASKEKLEKEGHNIAVEILPAKQFFPAEQYHQQYLEKGGQDASKNSRAPIRCYG